jgi:hypothetical protein
MILRGLPAFSTCIYYAYLVYMPQSTSSKVKGKGEVFTNYLHLVTFAQAAPELRSIKKSSTLLSPGKGSTLISPGKSSTLVLQNPDSAITKFVRL